MKLVEDINKTQEGIEEITNPKLQDQETSNLISLLEDKEQALIKVQRSLVKDLVQLIKEDEIMKTLSLLDKIAEAYYGISRQFDYISFREKIHRTINSQLRSYLKELGRI